MICPRCLLRRTAARRLPSHTHTRPFSNHPSHLAATQTVTAQTATATNPPPNDLPAATSTSAAQPFSEPRTSSPDRTADLPIRRNQTKQPEPRAPSSVPGGAVLKGLNFMKNARDPLALEDAEYPDWLWGVLEKNSKEGGKEGGAAVGGGGGGDEEGDLFSKSKKQRRIAAKALRRQQMLNPELLQPKVPLYEQSIDLPAGDGTLQGATQAAESRQELTHAMRSHRRAKIKEANFLKGMR